MADKRDTNAAEQQELLYMKQRQAVNDAYASLQGQAIAESFAAFTLEEAVDAQIERIEGASTQQHPNALDRVERVRQNLKQAVAQLKLVPPETFLDANLEEAVNTPLEEPEDTSSLYAQRLQNFDE